MDDRILCNCLDSYDKNVLLLAIASTLEEAERIKEEYDKSNSLLSTGIRNMTDKVINTYKKIQGKVKDTSECKIIPSVKII